LPAHIGADAGHRLTVSILWTSSLCTLLLVINCTNATPFHTTCPHLQTDISQCYIADKILS